MSKKQKNKYLKKLNDHKRVELKFTQKEREEISAYVIPDLVLDLSYRVDLFQKQDNVDKDKISFIVYTRIMNVINDYDSLYKRLSIVNSVYKIGVRIGRSYVDYLFPDLYPKLFSHAYLAEDDFNDYDPSSLTNIEKAENLAKEILRRSSYDYALEEYYGTWRDLGKCKTCNRHVTLDYGQFYRYYDKLHPKYNSHFPVHCIHCRTLKKMKKEYKLTHHRVDGKPLTDDYYKYIAREKRKAMKAIDNLTKRINEV